MFEPRLTLPPVLSHGVAGERIEISVGVPVIVPAISDAIDCRIDDEADSTDPDLGPDPDHNPGPDPGYGLGSCYDPVPSCDCEERGRRFPLCAAGAAFAIHSFCTLAAAYTACFLILLPRIPPDDDGDARASSSSLSPVSPYLLSCLIWIVAMAQSVLAKFVSSRVLRSGTDYDPVLRPAPCGGPPRTSPDRTGVRMGGYEDESDSGDIRFGRDCDGCHGPERRLDLAWTVGTFLGSLILKTLLDW